MDKVFNGFFTGLYHSLRVFYCFNSWNNIISRQEKADFEKQSHLNDETLLHNRSRVTRYAEAKRRHQLSTESLSSDMGSDSPSVSNPSSSSLSFSYQMYQKKKNVSFGMLKPLSHIYFVNFFFLFISYLACVYIVPAVFRITASYIISKYHIDLLCIIAHNIFVIVWVGPLCVIIEVLHYVNLRDIYKKIHRVRSKTLLHQNRQQPHNEVIQVATLIKNILTNVVFVPIFLISFNLQGIVISWIFDYVFCSHVLSIASCFLHRSLLYAFYSFEFSWILKGVAFNQRLYRIKIAWPYFLGYGMPVGLIMFFSSTLFGLGTVIINFLYPLFLIGACQVSWTDMQARVSLPSNTFIRSLPISYIFEPSLYFTNLIIDIRFFKRLSHKFASK